jgi:hypothetical protein
MISLIERFVNLPLPAKGAILLVSGGGVIAAAGYFLSPRAMMVMFLGVALLGALLVLYRLLLKWMDKRKAAPMEKALASNSAAAPTGVSDPARRASLDSMRRSFETGVEKFRAAGKNLYSLPWYALVGESGSGKTEAIRHCNVGFPPGLQDQLQGVGGTINMNWWFTNHAVILDTAGRLMFEEVEPGSTSEWQEFLKLLKKNRPNCPINGMLLVIPAESLIKDTADQLEKKGGKIAQQLDNIQRALGVRFPVFVVITKCDLINGFREFFDTLKDPQLQHQILGWSNPADLDQPFNPELVEQHLRTVQQRLQRRRLGLLLDPVHTEDPSARRANQVDALYAFPEALVKIAPRLRRYLEMIFVAGEWSAKPLFLRGIYFTSSMREGSALDADLAEAMGRPIESLPEGRIWERDRAYFLRDLFMQKVFREKGLVTRAVNTRQQQRKRQTVVMGSAAAGLLLVLVFTWLGWRGLRESIIGPRDFWSEATSAYAEAQTPAYVPGAAPYLLPLVYEETAGDPAFKFHYRGPEDTAIARRVKTGDREGLTAGRFPQRLVEQAKKEIKVPWIFYPVNLLTGSWDRNFLSDERANAARAIVEDSVARPLVDVVRRRMAADVAAGAWSDEASGALRQLVRIEVGALDNNRAPKPVDVEPLLRYVLAGTTDYAEFAAADRDALQAAVNWVHDPARGGRWASRLGSKDWALIAGGVKAFAASWKGAGASGDALGTLTAMIGELDALADAETKLQAVDNQAAGDAQKAVPAWNQALAPVREHASAVKKAMPALGDRTLDKAYTDELGKRRQELEKGLLAELSPLKPGETGKPSVASSSQAGDQARWKALDEARAALATLLVDSPEDKDRQSRLAKLEAMFLGGGAAKDRLFLARLDMYEAADAQLNPKSDAVDPKFGKLRPAMESLDAGLASASDMVAKRLTDLPANVPFATEANTLRKEAAAVSGFMVQVAGQTRRSRMIQDFLTRAPADGPAFAQAAERFAAEAGLTLARPSVPMTISAESGTFDPRYHPKAAAALLGDTAAVSKALSSSSEGAEAKVLSAKDLAGKFAPVKAASEAYAEAYLKYWSEGRNKDLAVMELPWGEFRKALGPHNQPTVFNSALADLADVIQEAVNAVDGIVPADQAALVKAIREDAARTKERLRKEDFVNTQRTVLGNWRNLDADVIDARRKLLDSVSAGKFDTNFVPGLTTDRGALGDFGARFWEELSYRALQSVASESEKQARTALAELRANARFPLAPPSPNQPQLSAVELAAAQSAIRKVRPPEIPGTAARIESKRFSDEIERLLGRNVLSKEHEEWADRVRGVLAGLPPSDAETYTCTVTLLTGEPRPVVGDDLASGTYRILGMSQGDAGEPVKASLRGNEQELGRLRYPGPPVKFLIYPSDVAGVKADVEVPVDGPWAALRLLHLNRDGRPTALGEGKTRTWKVELLVPGPDQKQRLSVWLKLEFEKELPPLRDWPR